MRGIVRGYKFLNESISVRRPTCFYRRTEIACFPETIVNLWKSSDLETHYRRDRAEIHEPSI